MGTSPNCSNCVKKSKRDHLQKVGVSPLYPLPPRISDKNSSYLTCQKYRYINCKQEHCPRTSEIETSWFLHLSVLTTSWFTLTIWHHPKSNTTDRRTYCCLTTKSIQQCNSVLGAVFTRLDNIFQRYFCYPEQSKKKA